MKKFDMRYGLKRIPLFNILECLVVMLMYMFQKRIGVSWIKKVEKCIFIGYKDGLKGYKLWNPEIKKIVYSRDVFLER
jgi:hypothetical protein